jgi:hypothetical protein
MRVNDAAGRSARPYIARAKSEVMLLRCGDAVAKDQPDFMCHALMRDPVVAADGHSYERRRRIPQGGDVNGHSHSCHSHSCTATLDCFYWGVVLCCFMLCCAKPDVQGGEPRRVRDAVLRQ